MLPKNFAFFGILLFFLTLVLITKSSEESLKEVFSSLPILTVEQRSAVIEKSLSGYQERVSEKLKQDIVNVTESYDRSKICDLMFGIMRSRPAASSFEETCRKVLTRDERSGVIKNILSLHNKSTTNFSIKRIIDQTEGYTTLQLSTFVFDAMKNPTFEQEINSRKLVYRSTEKQPTIKNQPHHYPMIKDIFHPGKAIFVEIAKQLRKGKLPEYLPKGILLYGPSGTGKNAMIEALVNESGCLIFSIGATELVTNIQGSGSSSTKEIFSRARRANPNRGVIILINELQSITPVTTDQSTPLAHTRSGQEYDNALTQLCIEYDQCSKNANILIAVTCNEFFRIDERIRGRFECIKFPCPNENGVYEILKNKSEYFGILLFPEEIERYVEKLNGLSGRDITHFVQKAKREISLGKTKEEALALAMQHQIRAARDARENSNRRFNQLRDEAIRGAVFGASGTLTKVLVVSVLTGIGFLGLLLTDGKDNGNKGTSPSHK